MTKLFWLAQRWRRRATLASLPSLCLWVGAAFGGCSVTWEYPDDDEETSFEACTDGIDNDFDGLVDCEEPSCGCNACGDEGTRLAVEPMSDAMGTFCRRSCECRAFALPLGSSAADNFRVCNPLALVAEDQVDGRCLAVEGLGADGEALVEEERFSVSFLLEQDDRGGVGIEGSLQNVVGLAQFNGQVFELSRARWQGRGLEFRNLTQDSVLEVFLEERRPEESDERFSVKDRVEIPKGSALRAQLGPITDGEMAGVNQVAIVESSTLTIQRVAGSPELVRGRWSGRLRPPAAVDRARGGSCVEEGGIFHPDGQICFAGDIRADSLFALGCVLDERAGTGTGLLAFWWPAPFSASMLERESANGECVARVSNNTLELRARNSAIQSARFAMRASIPLDVLSPSTTVIATTSTTANVPFVHFYRLSDAEKSKPLFSIDFDRPPDGEMETGRIAVEQINYSFPQRFFGWIEGRYGTPSNP